MIDRENGSPSLLHAATTAMNVANTATVKNDSLMVVWWSCEQWGEEGFLHRLLMCLLQEDATFFEASDAAVERKDAGP